MSDVAKTNLTHRSELNETRPLIRLVRLVTSFAEKHWQYVRGAR